MPKPYSIRIFLPGGDPDGIRTIEKSNWSGSGLVFPRVLMDQARQRKELERTGVYILLGPAEDNGLPKVYVGEGDSIRSRLDNHVKNKEFWDTCVAFTSTDENMNKAHIRYLESRLCALAAAGKRCILENSTTPQIPPISEADAAYAEGYLIELLLCLPTLGVSVFEMPSSSENEQTRVDFCIASKGIEAFGIETPKGFIVRAGSTAVIDEVRSMEGSLGSKLRVALQANAVLVSNGSALVFTQDYVFNSPSTAASVVLGRSANGREEWKTKRGQTLKAIQGGEAIL
ncbi:MAG TPA: GIY-YIG nuclease family protein [Candidatus Didemnitutus sp.]|nr:GIY-YIG nuclease family protein [Candidatus Didemnitutus sp.]